MSTISPEIYSPEITENGISDQEILDKVNAAEKQLGGTEFPALPKVEGAESLINKTVVVVDDTPIVLAQLAPYLLSATRGKGLLICDQGQGKESLAKQIVESAPDAVLIDGNLSGSLKGPDLVRAILALNPNLKCYAFTITYKSDSDSAGVDLLKDFEASGAVGRINKAPLEKNKGIIREIAQKIA